MRIIHFIPHFGQGGDWTIVKMLGRESAGQGHEVVINGLELEQALTPDGLTNRFPLNEGLVGLLKSLRNLGCLPRDADILHAHSPICLLFAALVRLLRCPRSAIVFTFHWPVPDHGIRHLVKRWIFNLADVLHVYSQDIDEIVKIRYGIGVEKVHLLYTGLNEGRFEPGHRDQARVGLGMAGEAKVLGYLGRLATEKNVGYLIRFLHEHHAEFGDLELWIAGAGDLEPGLREAAAAGPGAKHIHFLGYSREPECIYPAFDLLVLPSDFEAFALVVVEAAYCGVPTLRSDVEGSRDQIHHGVDGFIYPQSGGYEAMEAELLRILRHDWGRLPEIGNAARAHCLALCDIKRFRVGLDALLNGALSRIGRADP